MLFKEPCTKSSDPTSDLYLSSAKKNPSKAASVCTHTQVNSVNKVEQELCSKMKDEEACGKEKACQYTPKYGIKNEKATCEGKDQLIEVDEKSPVAYTEESCDLACVMQGSCVEFSIGRKYESNKGKCLLFAAGCKKSDEKTYDFYAS